MVDTAYVGVTLPAGWQIVDQKDWYIRARWPGKGEFTLVSGPNPNPPTTQGWIEANLNTDQGRDANASICVGPQEVNMQHGPTAQGYIICLTVVPEGGGEAYEVYDLFNTQVDEAAKVVYQLELWASRATFDEMLEVVRNEVSPTLVWKLYKP